MTTGLPAAQQQQRQQVKVQEGTAATEQMTDGGNDDPDIDTDLEDSSDSGDTKAAGSPPAGRSHLPPPVVKPGEAETAAKREGGGSTNVKVSKPEGERQIPDPPASPVHCTTSCAGHCVLSACPQRVVAADK